MAATPARGVHWDVKNLSPSFLNSPNFEGSTESYISTSSFEYVNNQLVAHGFAPSPGLSLSGLSGTDSDRVVKCLLGMLSQRVEDMSRTEELSTQLRTLTYDYERLLTMHRTSNEKLANAEREVNLHKTKLIATMRTLQSAESTHKQTTAELQRTRTAIQGVRASHQTELKKKEKELERMVDKWNKLSDAQTKLATVPAGLRCVNIAIVDGTELVPRTPSLLDSALDDAEKAREQLLDEVARLRRLVVKIVNQVQAVLHQVRAYISDKEQEPPAYTLTNLFPMHPPTHAHDTLSRTLSALKDSLAALPQHIASSATSSQNLTLKFSATTTTTTQPAEPNSEEITRLQVTIAQLKDEKKQLQKQAQLQATETQALFDNFIASQRKTSANIAELSVELMTAPMADAERKRLDKFRLELDREREKFTQAAIKLGEERAALEVDKNKLLDEKRSWEVQQILADLPPTPNPLLLQPRQHRQPQLPKSSCTTIHHSPSKKSPRKQHHKRTGSSSRRRSTRVFRRPSTTPTKTTSNTIPSYETELIVTTPDFQSPEEPEDQWRQELLPQHHQHTVPPPIAVPSFSLKPTASILPSSFVLPPPSPHSSLRTPLLPPSADQLTTLTSSSLVIPQPDFLTAHLPPDKESTPFPQLKSHSHNQHQDEQQGVSGQSLENGIEMTNMTTPIKRGFPVAKPLAQRMIHAYSPAKPSPLSRILMLSDSPLDGANSSLSTTDRRSGLGVVREEDSAAEAIESNYGIEGTREMFPGLQLEMRTQTQPHTPPHQEGPEHRMSLAAELGVESPPDIVQVEAEEVLLKERKAETNGNGRSAATRANGKPTTTTATSKTGVSDASADARKPNLGLDVQARPKSRSNAEKTANGAFAREKENGVPSKQANVKASGSVSTTASNVAKSASNGRITKPASITTTATASKSTTSAAAKTSSSRFKPLTGAAGGARRVPINSAEAPAIGRRNS